MLVDTSGLAGGSDACRSSGELGNVEIEKEGDALMRRIPFGQVEKLSVSIGSLSLLYHFLTGGDVDLHAAVLCASGGGFVGCDRVVPTFA